MIIWIYACPVCKMILEVSFHMQDDDTYHVPNVMPHICYGHKEDMILAGAYYAAV